MSMSREFAGFVPHDCGFRARRAPTRPARACTRRINQKAIRLSANCGRRDFRRGHCGSTTTSRLHGNERPQIRRTRARRDRRRSRRVRRDVPRAPAVRRFRARGRRRCADRAQRAPQHGALDGRRARRPKHVHRAMRGSRAPRSRSRRSPRSRCSARSPAAASSSARTLRRSRAPIELARVDRDRAVFSVGAAAAIHFSALPARSLAAPRSRCRSRSRSRPSHSRACTFRGGP